MLTYQITEDSLENMLVSSELAGALNQPEKAIYAVDEFGFLVFVLSQVKLQSSDATAGTHRAFVGFEK